MQFCDLIKLLTKAVPEEIRKYEDQYTIAIIYMEKTIRFEWSLDYKDKELNIDRVIGTDAICLPSEMESYINESIIKPVRENLVKATQHVDENA